MAFDRKMDLVSREERRQTKIHHEIDLHDPTKKNP